jgi:hypothetical protein
MFLLTRYGVGMVTVMGALALVSRDCEVVKLPVHTKGQLGKGVRVVVLLLAFTPHTLVLSTA